MLLYLVKTRFEGLFYSVEVLLAVWELLYKRDRLVLKISPEGRQAAVGNLDVLAIDEAVGSCIKDAFESGEKVLLHECLEGYIWFLFLDFISFLPLLGVFYFFICLVVQV